MESRASQYSLDNEEPDDADHYIDQELVEAVESDEEDENYDFDNFEQPDVEELFDELTIRQEMDALRRENPQLAERIGYINDCCGAGAGTTVAVEEVLDPELRGTRMPTISDKTMQIKQFFLDVFGRLLQSNVRFRIDNLRKEDTSAEERDGSSRLIRAHYNAALVWARSRFEGLPGGRYPTAVIWPFTLKELTLGSSAGNLRTFIDFLYDKIVLPTGQPFEYGRLDEFESAKQLLNEFIEYFINERRIQVQETKKCSALKRQKKLTAAEKLQAAGAPLPATVLGTVLGTCTAFRLLAVSDPQRGLSIWVSKGTRASIKDYVLANIGAVHAHSSWPLLYKDAQRAFEENTPEDMTGLSMYLLVLLMCKFGFRPSDVLRQRKTANLPLNGQKSTGLLLEDIDSISYDERQDRWKIVFTVTYSKTSKEKTFGVQKTIYSEDCKADLARLVVLFLALRNAFVHPLPVAMQQNDFAIRENMLKLSLFGGPVGGRMYNTERIPVTTYANAAFRSLSIASGLPSNFISPRSARQGYAFYRCFKYISDSKNPTFDDCVKVLRGVRDWTTNAAKHYIEPCEQPLTEVILAVEEERRAHPHKKVDAFDHYVSVSRILMLDNVRRISDVDRRAIQKIGEFVEKQKRLECDRKQAALFDDARMFHEQNREDEVRNVMSELDNIVSYAARGPQKCRERAMLRAENVIKTDYIRSAINQNIELPELRPLSKEVLDLRTTFEVLRSRTHAPWEMTNYTVDFPLQYGQKARCPLDDCNFYFDKVDGEHGVVRHMQIIHFVEGQSATCRNHPNKELSSVSDWTNHFKAAHKYLICFDCIDNENLTTGWKGFQRGHIVGCLLPRSVYHGLYPSEHRAKTGHDDVRHYDGIKLFFTSARPYECGCPKDRCPFHDVHGLRAILNDDILSAGAILHTPGQAPNRYTKKKFFTAMGRNLCRDGPYEEAQIEQCLEFYYADLFPTRAN